MPVHIVNPMWNASGGSEQRTAALYDALKPYGEVHVWSEFRVDARLAARVPVRRISPPEQPDGGTLVFVGVYFPIGDWITSARARRVILVANTAAPEAIHKLTVSLLVATRQRVELVYASRALLEMTGLRGRVEPSPIDLTRFTRPREARDASRFVVGRISRDAPEKHHEEDPLLYAEISRRGCEVRIMGGTCLRERGAPPEVRLLPDGAMDAADFLRDLDCFLYRTSTGSFEAYGRVIIEAMACGLPVVAHQRGGYVELLQHEGNGLLFDTTVSACEFVLRLRDDPALRERLGGAARESVRRCYSDGYWAGLVEYYFR